jgi:hypothetical protein
LDGKGQPVPQPAAVELRRLEILLTPYGFLKGAMAQGANPTVLTRNESGSRVTVVSFVAFGKYRVNGTITPDNMVGRVQTWVPNPVVGDLYYENVYTNYRDMGVKIPGSISIRIMTTARAPECRRRSCLWSEKPSRTLKRMWRRRARVQTVESCD